MSPHAQPGCVTCGKRKIFEYPSNRKPVVGSWEKGRHPFRKRSIVANCWAARVPGVASLDKCRVRKSGLSYLVDIQIRVPGDLSVREGHGIAHAVNDTLLASRLRVSDVTVHVEPY